MESNILKPLNFVFYIQILQASLFCVEKNYFSFKKATMEDTKRSISQIQQQQQQQQPQLVTTAMISTIDFEMNRITETMIQYKVRRNMESYGKRYVTWMGCYLLFFLVCLSGAILVTVSIGVTC
jgi:hypothetical protein